MKVIKKLGSEEITKDFLKAALNEKITKVDLSKNPILRKLRLDDKMGVLDVIAEIDDREYCNIEMQMSNKDDLIKRFLFYWAKTYSRNIHTGDFYEKLKRTIVVIITDFEVKGLEELEYCTKWKIIEEKQRKIILTDLMEIVIIELPKIYRKRDNNDRLLQWTYFLDNLKSEEVKKIMEENEVIKKANEKLEEISDDEIMQRIAEWKEDGLRLEKGRQVRFERELKEGIEKAKKEGKEQGIAEGRKEGIQQGIQEGMQQGIEQGEKQEKIQIAKKMKMQGMDIEIIIKITDLSKEEIEKL